MDVPLAVAPPTSAVDTGRVVGGLGARSSRIVFGATADAGIDAELPWVSTIDQAHLLMLAARGLIAPASAVALLVEIDRLRGDGFAPLRGRPAARGAYLLYEEHLIGLLGPAVGGVLHTGRSRNDLKATVHQLRAREQVASVLSGLLRLQAVLLAAARRHRSTVMPAFSQYQPAVPVSYGWYLLGIAEALDADITGVWHAARSLRRCPLGAAAGAGTDVPVDPAHTARLLGFDEPVEHAGYSVASRDGLVRLLSAGALAGLTLSRLAADLQLWSTPEFGLVDFPDSLVGSSSAMPQKRNPFLLEHIKGGAGALIGAWTAAASVTRAVPFGNSVEATTDAVAPIWPALGQLVDVLGLALSVVAGARPRADAMLADADRGGTVATALANRLVAAGVPFRVAHRAVGRLITGLAGGGPVSGSAMVAASADLDRVLRDEGFPVDLGAVLTGLDPAAVCLATDFGGGPGPRSFDRAHARLLADWRDRVRDAREWAARVRAADDERSAAVRALVAGVGR
ncbi:argininosuccinate lyase [Saccharothrix luteola]|uniref:argininosuccinate lyase n=1 Tax=Saccharothrix luteola TaxID=2893018 RepID=UPI001E556FA7|nr:argininosuccinate lyase [Saccharothrix luteola]MCC8250852.1 argininosuccinate lyase [Saccharothrix luteola]